MEWYSGNIAEAVQRSKQEGAVFFVAIFGEDEQSRQLEESVNSTEIQTVLSSGKYVCIRLAANSQEHVQFKQIYSNAESPCLYFISLMGAPVEIVHGETAANELKDRCESAWSKHSKVLQAQKAPPQTPIQPVAAASTQQPNSSQAQTGASGSRENTPKREESTPQDDAAAEANMTLEQKIERARILAAAKAKLKFEQEAEEARRREKERREAGKGAAELKRWQEEQEAKRVIEERKRDKREEQELRQKIKDQIAQDRAERNKRTNASIVYDNAEPGPSSAAPKPNVLSAAPVDYTGKARLQFRMPDGSSQTHTFEKDVTLGHVRTFLIDGGHVKFRNFSLCVTYPRREFTSTEYEKSLSDLGLLPSAALLVIPAGGNVFGTSAVGGGAGLWAWVTVFIGYILFPVTYLFGVMQRALPSSESGNSQQSSTKESESGRLSGGEHRLGGSGSGSARPGNLAKPPPGSGPSPSSSEDSVRKRNVNSERKSDGNIHRLRNQETDSDDDPGTWNGNSTQQKPR